MKVSPATGCVPAAIEHRGSVLGPAEPEQGSLAGLFPAGNAGSDRLVFQPAQLSRPRRP